jgi:pimeloyl-ACP methyl ester carboxylesterase
LSEGEPREAGKPRTAGQKRRGAGCMRWLGRAALGALALLLVLMAVGAIYQAVASAKDAKTYKPLNQMVDVIGIQMRLDCRGSGSPTVVLEAGASIYSIAWARVQDDVAKFTRVCSYDRAGLGWSEGVREAQSPQQVAEMLQALLANGGEQSPYLMVGHSLGGIYVRAFAALYPQDMAGMVLVDSSHENQNQLLPAEFVKLNKTQMFAIRFCQAAAPFGLVRAVKMMDSLVAVFQLTEEEKKPLLAAMNRTTYCGAAARELDMFSAYTSQPRELAKLGDMPLVVLTSGYTAQEMYAELPPAFQSQVNIEVVQAEAQAWNAMQEELAGLSARGKRIVVRESGHNIQLDAPQVIIAAIREVFEQAAH